DQSKRVSQRLKTGLGDDIFTSWFARMEFEEADGATVYLSVPTAFLKSWILAHYNDRLLALWQEERPATHRVEIRVRGTIRSKAVPRAEKVVAAVPLTIPAAVSAPLLKRPQEPEGPLGGSPVDPRFTYETFCEG